MTSQRLLLLTLVLLTLAVLSGRILAGALKARILLRFDPTSAAASSLLGIASWTLGLSWLSAAGSTMPRGATWLLLGHLGGLAVCWGRGTLPALRPVGSRNAWLALLGAWGAALLLAMLPLLRTGGFATCNDTYHYAAFSEWLQQNAWSTQVQWDPSSPVTYIPSMFQGVGYPLAAAYLLALVRAIFTSVPSLALYPAISALGMLLNVAAQYVVGRWVFRLPERWAAGGSLAFGLLPHAIYWGHHNGFLQQTYGVSVLLLAIALLARASRPALWDVATAALVAIAAAYLLLVYIPMGPPLGIGFLPWAFVSIRRAVRGRAVSRWLWAVAACAVLFVGLAFPALPGIWARLLSFARSQAGGHISWEAWDYVSFAVGSKLGPGDWGSGLLPSLRRAHAGMTPVYVVLIAWGIWRALLRPRTFALLGALAYVFALVSHYALVARDPWSGQTGHTWNLFKLTQYAFPLLFSIMVFATRDLARRGGLFPRIALAGGLVLPWMVIPIHWAWSAEVGRSSKAILVGERPLESVPDLRRRLSGLPPGTLYVLGRPAELHACLGDTLALLAYPRAIVSDWEGTYHVPPLPDMPGTIGRLLASPGPSRVVTLVPGEPLFSSEGAESLGPGLTWLREAAPRVLRLEESGVRDRVRRDGWFDWTGGRRLRISIFSPRAVRASLELDVRPRSSSAGAHRWVRVGTAPGKLRGPALRRALDPAAWQEVDLGVSDGTLRIPVRLETGITTVVFERRDPGAGPLPPDGTLLSITGARLVEPR